MPEVDEYIRLAASNFKIAEERFKDAEDALRTLQVELNTCAERLAGIRHIDLLSWEQLGVNVPARRPAEIRGLHMVRS
jgi:hypothetical protein